MDKNVIMDLQTSIHPVEPLKSLKRGRGEPQILPAIASKRKPSFDREIHRYETKYVIPKWLVPKIREYIRPFCAPDPHCVGDPPAYCINTLQLDTPGMSLHYAKLWDFVNRFKLRVRTYGDRVGNSPVFLEIKSKCGNTVVKRRCQIPLEKWGPQLFGNETIRGIEFGSKAAEDNFYQFVRLVKQIGARPVMLIRYRRESYLGKWESYSRVTFDSQLQYQQTRSWNSWGRDGEWRALDNPMMQTRRHDREVDFSGAVLELKALSDVPQWMVNLTTEFDLWRVGHCKYSNAVWAESIFRATPWPPEYEIDLLRYL